MSCVSPGEVVHGEVVDEETRVDERIQILHDRSTQEENHLPVIHVNHLTCRKEWESEMMNGIVYNSVGYQLI